VPDFALVVGVPARQIGWMSRFGERLELPLEASVGNPAEVACPNSADRYRLDGAVLSLI
jgi:UDP-2-acetamido-3-amino-2,3-dideoxy-glucuronate N-acetyltransferase